MPSARVQTPASTRLDPVSTRASPRPQCTYRHARVPRHVFWEKVLPRALLSDIDDRLHDYDERVKKLEAKLHAERGLITIIDSLAVSPTSVVASTPCHN